jgi:hypothetical protein
LDEPAWNPGVLNQWFIAQATIGPRRKRHSFIEASCDLDWSTGKWDRLGVKISKVKNTGRHASNWQSAEKSWLPRIARELNNGNPVIAKVWFAEGGNTHYVVITGVHTWWQKETGSRLIPKGGNVYLDYLYLAGTSYKWLRRHGWRWKSYSYNELQGDFLMNHPAQWGKEKEKGIDLFGDQNRKKVPRTYTLMNLYTVRP